MHWLIILPLHQQEEEKEEEKENLRLKTKSRAVFDTLVKIPSGTHPSHRVPLCCRFNFLLMHTLGMAEAQIFPSLPFTGKIQTEFMFPSFNLNQQIERPDKKN